MTAENKGCILPADGQAGEYKDDDINGVASFFKAPEGKPIKESEPKLNCKGGRCAVREAFAQAVPGNPVSLHGECTVTGNTVTVDIYVT